jgi:Conserved in the green lineage and diatoms 27
MSTSSSFCPVPKEQQPINEYQELQNSWFFGWAKLAPAKYITKLIWVGVWSLIVTAPLAEASFSIAKSPIQFGVCAIGGSLVFITFAAIRLYLGWIHVKERLYNESVFYEESGWYDGQTWIKTPEILDRDRLIVSYEVQPILKRIQLTFLTILITTIVGISAWMII